VARCSPVATLCATYQAAIKGSRPRTARHWRWSTTLPATRQIATGRQHRRQPAACVCRAGRGAWDDRRRQRVVQFRSGWMTNTPQLTIYTAAKATMHGMSRSMSREYGSTASAPTRWCRGGSDRAADRSMPARAGSDARKYSHWRRSPGHRPHGDVPLCRRSRMISGQDFLVDGAGPTASTAGAGVG
jgi:NAD(P)-dependent dehydrogenase (short-subunit alcohol dehydrogenase family)